MSKHSNNLRHKERIRQLIRAGHNPYHGDPFPGDADNILADDALRGGLTRGGPTRGGPARGVPSRAGSVAGGSARGGSTAGGPTGGGSIAGASIAGGSIAGGSVAGGSVVRGSIGRGSTAGSSTAGSTIRGGPFGRARGRGGFRGGLPTVIGAGARDVPDDDVLPDDSLTIITENTWRGRGRGGTPIGGHGGPRSNYGGSVASGSNDPWDPTASEWGDASNAGSVMTQQQPSAGGHMYVPGGSVAGSVDGRPESVFSAPDPTFAPQGSELARGRGRGRGQRPARRR